DGRRVGRAGVRAAVVGPPQGGRGAGPAGGDHEGGLGQPVARGERLGAEPGRCEGVGEAAQGGRPDRFGAVEGDPPAAEVQFVGEGGRGVLQGEFVGEVGAALVVGRWRLTASKQRRGCWRKSSGEKRVLVPPVYTVLSTGPMRPMSW